MGSDWNRRVRERAYAIWESRGRPDGASHEDWIAAERDIADASGNERTDEIEPGDETPAASPKTASKRAAASGSTGEPPAKTAKPAKETTTDKKGGKKDKASATLGAG